MSGLPPKPITTATGTVEKGIADIASVKTKKAEYAASGDAQNAVEAESKRLIAENTSTDNGEKLSLKMPGGKPRKSRRHPRRSRKNKQSRRRRQRHH